MTREELIALLEWPLGDDNLMPRMHHDAKRQWMGNIITLGNYIAELQQLCVIKQARIEDYSEEIKYKENKIKQLKSVLVICEAFIWNDFDPDNERMAIELQLAREAVRQVHTSPALDKDARIAELTQALQFYGSKNNWQETGIDYSPCWIDKGDTARAALAPRSADGKRKGDV